MASIRQFCLSDLLIFGNVNMDSFTETFHTSFYGQYILTWSELCPIISNSLGKVQGYLLGKVEGNQDNNLVKNWHGHNSAVTVAREFRRLGIAKKLMDYFEEKCIKTHNAYYIDLFVRESNNVAINMYKNLGYIVYRTILKYYGNDAKTGENALDMLKSLPRDNNKSCLIAPKKEIMPYEVEFF